MLGTEKVSFDKFSKTGAFNNEILIYVIHIQTRQEKMKFIINFNFLCVVVQHQGRNSTKLLESTDHLCKLQKTKKQKKKN